MVNVWATWCPTCLSEHEELMRIAQATDIVIVGVNYRITRLEGATMACTVRQPHDWVR